MSESGQSNKD
jgi:transcription elongation factor SPT6